MGVVGRLDQYASMLAWEFDETTANNMSITGLGTYYSSEFNENIVDIVRNGLVLNLDAGNLSSYPGTGTTWTDLSGNSNNGTLTNGPTYSSANNGSIVFDGTNDYVTINQTLSTPFTVTGFVRYTDQAKIQNSFINTNPHTTFLISLNRTGTGDIYVYIGNGSSWLATPAIISSTNMIVNQWYQVSFTTTGSGSILYLNGVNVGTSVHSPSGWGSTYYLGTIIIASGEYLRGNIANTQIYNRALTATEIQQNYNAFATRYGLTTTNSTAPMSANVFAPYDPVYDEFSGTSFGAGQGRYMRQNTDKSVIVYNEIDEVTDLFGRGIVRDGLVLDLDAGISASYAGRNYYITPQTLTNGRTGTTSGGNYTDFTTGGPTDGRFTRWVRNTALTRTDDWDWSIGYTNTGLSVGQILTVSFYARCPNGTLSNITLNSPDSVAINATLDSTWRRYSGTVIYGGDYVSTPFVRINRGNSNAYVNGATYDIAQFQIEKGSVLTDFVDGTIWTDLGVYSNNGTLTNVPTYSSSNGGSIVFDGIDDYATVSDVTGVTDFSNTNNYTVDFWVYVNSTQNDTRNADNNIVEKWSQVGSYPYTFRYVRSSQIIRAAAYNGTSDNSTSVTVSPNNWVHICGVFNWSSSLLTLYMNGGSVTSSTALNLTGTITNDSALNLMRRGNGFNYVTGRLSNLKIYNRALTAAEVSQNYNALKGRFGL
jgi:hypothetical protein